LEKDELTSLLVMFVRRFLAGRAWRCGEEAVRCESVGPSVFLTGLPYFFDGKQITRHDVQSFANAAKNVQVDTCVDTTAHRQSLVISQAGLFSEISGRDFSLVKDRGDRQTDGHGGHNV
jgi:hypothetical protein